MPRDIRPKYPHTNEDLIKTVYSVRRQKTLGDTYSDRKWLNAREIYESYHPWRWIRNAIDRDVYKL